MGGLLFTPLLTDSALAGVVGGATLLAFWDSQSQGVLHVGRRITMPAGIYGYSVPNQPLGGDLRRIYGPSRHPFGTRQLSLRIFTLVALPPPCGQGWLCRVGWYPWVGWSMRHGPAFLILGQLAISGPIQTQDLQPGLVGVG
jgi:hypothetical protein